MRARAGQTFNLLYDEVFRDTHAHTRDITDILKAT